MYRRWSSKWYPSMSTCHTVWLQCFPQHTVQLYMYACSQCKHAHKNNMQCIHYFTLRCSLLLHMSSFFPHFLFKNSCSFPVGLSRRHCSGVLSCSLARGTTEMHDKHIYTSIHSFLFLLPFIPFRGAGAIWRIWICIFKLQKGYTTESSHGHVTLTQRVRG